MKNILLALVLLFSVFVFSKKNNNIVNLNSHRDVDSLYFNNKVDSSEYNFLIKSKAELTKLSKQKS